ncbi:unnamed protein product [Phytophthora lilii]|uniref:Unnamed protein product n=1 Tax=Phytophthora lilii TaxID=2077276 RepID=A0A9W6UA11_9STRA|nr:unnamed protein product [Phytophthora lilii]
MLTEIMAGLMPNLHVDLEKVRGSRHFGMFDFIKGYWQLPLAKECQEMLSYMTHRKIYTPTRVPQVWIDDLLLYAADIDTYLDKLEELLQLTAQSHAIPVERRRTACSTNWMRDIIVDNARLASTARCTGQSHGSGIKANQTSGSGYTHQHECKAYDAVKQALADSATLAFPKPDSEMVLLTDASDIGWSVIVPQVPCWDSDGDIQDQQHELLICLGGTFTGAQRNWSVIEKEAYPIVVACGRLSYLLMRPREFRMYCDHRKLIHIFAPGHEVKKHVRGIHNTCADMVSRWAGTRPSSSVAVKHVTLRRQRGDDHTDEPTLRRNTVPVPIRPFSDGNFVWPTVEELRTAQQRHVGDRDLHEIVLNYRVAMGESGSRQVRAG